MPDMRIETRFSGLSTGECLERAKNAARAMGIAINQETATSFVAGSQWWGSYEIEVEVRGDNVQLDGRTLKIGFDSRLEDKLTRFLYLMRNPAQQAPTDRSELDAPPRVEPHPGWWREPRDYEPPPAEPREETLTMHPLLVAYAVGVASGLTATLMWEGGKWLVHEMKDDAGKPVSERPAVLYSPDHRMTYRKRADGSYEPTGSTRHD